MQEYSITPEFNADIEILEAKVKALNIQSETDNIAASQLLAEIDSTLKSVTGRRDAVIEHYEEMIADTRSEYKPFVSSLTSLRDTVKNEMLSYKERAKMKIQEIRQSIENGTIERKELFVSEDGKIINESALSIRTTDGLSSIRKYYHIEVTDFSKIPDNYKIFDKKKVLADLKKGVKNIPGIIATQKNAMQIRSKSTKAA